MAKTDLIAASPRDHAIQSLRGLIERSGLSLGDRLPAESKLAAQFAVSRMTVRKALDVLEREGLVRRERNLGCVCAATPKPAGGLMARTVILATDHGAASDTETFGGGSPAIVSGVMAALARRDFNFLRVAPADDDGAWLNELIASGTPGVIVSFWARPIPWQLQVLRRLAASGLPVVTWGESDAFAGYDRIASDHVSGTVQLVNALADAGCRHILRLWTPPATAPWIEAHNVGYEQAAATRGLPLLPPVYVEGLPERDRTTEANYRARVRYFAGYLAEHLHGDSKTDAIMVATDCEALAVMAALRLFGRTDIRVTGYDNYWHDAYERKWETAIPFATVDKNNHGIGEALAGLMADRIASQLPPGPQKRLLAQQLVLSAESSRSSH
jgi:DNA-binding LacI/PurR family transcriptional regulator